MTKRSLDDDFDELNHGLQGTRTGSAMNQLGLDARPDRAESRAPERGLRNQADGGRAAHEPPDTLGFSWAFAAIGFVLAGGWMWQRPDVGELGAVLVATIVGALSGRFYKVLLAFAAVVIGALALERFGFL